MICSKCTVKATGLNIWFSGDSLVSRIITNSMSNEPKHPSAGSLERLSVITRHRGSRILVPINTEYYDTLGLGSKKFPTLTSSRKWLNRHLKLLKR